MVEVKLMLLLDITSTITSWLTQQAMSQICSMLWHLSPIGLIVLGIIILFAGKAIIKLIAVILILIGILALFGMSIWQVI